MSENVNRHYADFFVDQARKSPNKFANYDEELTNLVENYDLIVTEKYEGAVFAFEGAKQTE